MATATQQYIKNDDVNEMGCTYTGKWLTAGTKGAHTIKFPGKVAYFMCVLNVNASATPDILYKWADQAVDTTVVNVLTVMDAGSLGGQTMVADATTVTIAHLPNGTSTVLVALDQQDNDGVNYWFACCYK